MRHAPPTRALAVAALFAATPALADTPSFTPLGTLPGHTVSHAYAISGDGSTVAGTSRNPVTGFTHTGGPLDPIGLDTAYATAANGATVVGQLGGEAAYWSGGAASLVNTPPQFSSSRANDASADGAVIVGWGATSSGDTAFRWTSGSLAQDLGHLPGASVTRARAVSDDGSIIVGNSGPSTADYAAFRWTSDTGIQPLPIPTEFDSIAQDISADGSTIVGGYGFEAFRYSDADGFQNLGALGAAAYASATSADGSVVVGFAFDGAFIWDQAHGMRPLRDILVGLGIDMTGWSLLEASAISDDGLTIAGSARIQGGETQAFVAHIPAPSAAAPLLGLIPLASRRRRNP